MGGLRGRVWGVWGYGVGGAGRRNGGVRTVCRGSAISRPDDLFFFLAGGRTRRTIMPDAAVSPCMYPRIISPTMHVCHLYLQKPLPASFPPHPPLPRPRCTSQDAVEDARPLVEVLHGRIQAMGIKRCPSFSKRPGFPCGLRVLVVDEDSSARADAEALLCNCNYVVRNCAAVQANAARGG